MKMISIACSEVDVVFNHEVKTKTGFEIQKIEAHDAPLEKFYDAMKGLAPVVASIMEVPSEWAAGITVNKLSISYTKNGTRSATIQFTKVLDRTTCQHPLKTPMFQIDDGGKGEDTRRQCTPKHAAAVEEMIKRAEDYANGKRSQMQLGLTSSDKAAKDDKADAAAGQKIMFSNAAGGE